MRPSYIVVAAASILSAHHDTLTASAANDVALTGVVSLGFLQLVGADQRISDEPRFLRGNKIAEGDNEERRFAENSKDLVNKLLKTNSFSALKNTDSLVVLKKAEALSDDHMKGCSSSLATQVCVLQI
ncbi:hypothetical protein GQ600_5014 [Phytophthora cactorum]|nr:hypothetical protein GQ600_5014 [Phytophthora cactorum]